MNESTSTYISIVLYHPQQQLCRFIKNHQLSFSSLELDIIACNAMELLTTCDAPRRYAKNKKSDEK